MESELYSRIVIPNFFVSKLPHNTVAAHKRDTLRNKLKQKHFFHSFIILFFSRYAWNVERAYI